MVKVVLFILLLTVVYSFEQFLDVITVFLFRLLKRHKTPKDYYYIDQAVGSLLIFATFPIGLAYWLASPGILTTKLIVVVIQLIAAAGLIYSLQHISRYGAEIGSLASHLVSSPLKGLFAPNHDQRVIGRYIISLCVPLLGAVFLKLSMKDNTLVLQDRIDQLITVALYGMFISVAIKFLEEHFRLYRLHLFGYFRILLGIVIILLLNQ
jgi:hypothetical protein